MEETILYEAVLAKHAANYMKVAGFNERAFFSDSPETIKSFGDAVYFIDRRWLDRATKEIYGW